MKSGADTNGYVIPARYWVWLGAPRAWAVLLWVAALGLAAYLLFHAWTWFETRNDQPVERRRADGNRGHAYIDFGGQWVMGRMVVKGYTHELYHRQRQWEVVREGFPVADEAPVARTFGHLPPSERPPAKPDEDFRHDADRMMSWFMGSDPPAWRTIGGAAAASIAGGATGHPFTPAVFMVVAREVITPNVREEVEAAAVGGPLYPPVHAFLYAPLALLRPLPAYHVFQVIAVAMIFVAGLGVKVITRGRIWWSVATLALLLYSGTRAGLDLGQNPAITLAIAIWGWALASRGYNSAGGMVWGLFAFKPVWALAFSIVPLLTRRWRFCAAMIGTGVSLCALTLPFVGFQTWLDWLSVGKEAASVYNVNQNWIHLSRDLQSIPRRMLHDFTVAEAHRDTMLARTLAWSLWSAVFVLTVGVYLRFADHRRATGIGMAFLFFGAWLTCYRFMYYDALVSALGCAVLFAKPERFLRTRLLTLSPSTAPPIDRTRPLEPKLHPPAPLAARWLGYTCSLPVTILFLLLIVENSINGMTLQATLGFGYYAHVTTAADGATGRATPRIVGDTSSNYPWETILILILWTWCGIRLLVGEERKSHDANDAK